MYDIKNVAQAFFPNESIISVDPLGNGHINSTFLVTTNINKYTMQKINTSIFKDVDGLMANVQAVTHHIRDMARQSGIDPTRATLHFMLAPDGNRYLNYEGDIFRAYIYIDNAYSIEKMENAEDFYQAGIAFGKFANDLSGFDASVLTETIKNFHNTVSRYNDFEKAVSDNISGRRDEVQEEIEFVRQRKEFTHMFVDRLNDGSLPVRVTHNDTKLNNVLFDKDTNLPTTVIDLDTVMPGSYLYDFGDAMRSGSTHAAEDEKDLSLVDFDLGLYEAFTKGYLSMCKDSLTETEIELLPYASIMLTLECGMRFLGDHLNGDTYFKIHREGHNLDRCRTQFKLVSLMEQNVDNMKAIIEKYAK
ncbi:MAG: aminoglycoside phosphotransferase family protein [Ruminococcaceae bacterium]|nr:aminoglycoside phosphotransferase family protein [Oscillospiraceae bacterium]